MITNIIYLINRKSKQSCTGIRPGGDQLQREKKEEGVNQSAVIDKKAVESLCLKGYRGLTVCILWSKFKVVKEV